MGRCFSAAAAVRSAVTRHRHVWRLQAGLNDTLGAEVVIKQLLSVDSVSGDGVSTSWDRINARRLNNPAALMFGEAASAAAWTYPKAAAPAFQLPENVELTTWETLNATAMLVRLTHMFTPGEHPTLSRPATVSLCPLLGTACSGGRITVLLALTHVYRT